MVFEVRFRTVTITVKGFEKVDVLDNLLVYIVIDLKVRCLPLSEFLQKDHQGIVLP
jgi:hypothetical protein